MTQTFLDKSKWLLITQLETVTDDDYLVALCCVELVRVATHLVSFLLLFDEFLHYFIGFGRPE